MNRYTSLNKTYKVITMEEAYFRFPDMKADIAETPSCYVYLVITDERPGPKPIPPQLIGPMKQGEAERQIKEREENHCSNMQSILDRLDGCDNIIKIGDDENELD